jgi:hypothetical protein
MDAAAEIAREIAALPVRDTPSVRAVRKRWSQALKGSSAAEVLAVARIVEAEAPQTGKWVAYELLRFHPAAFAAISERDITEYAGRLAPGMPWTRSARS